MKPNQSIPEARHFEVAIVGAGTGGLTVAARLQRSREFRSIVVIDPATDHYYQPLFTLVGAGVTDMKVTHRPTTDLIPSGCEWMKEAVHVFEPESYRLRTSSGSLISYDYLVVAAGMQLDWAKIPGLKEALGKGQVCSNYARNIVPYTWECIKQTKSGKAIFTYPETPIKCGGAPQKIMYLAEDYWRKHGARPHTDVWFRSAAPALFGVPKYRAALEKIVAERGIRTSFKTRLIGVDGPANRATFENMETNEQFEEEYSFLHAVPPMSAPDFIKQSPLADQSGWVSVDKYTLQHTKYPTVFSIGDASSLPTSKTGAAIRKEAPVLVKNMIAHKKGRPLLAKYDGYTSCPLVTGYGRLILAEFDYDGNPAETFPFDQSKERLSMYLLKKHFLPKMYWHGMLKGRM